MSDAAKTAPSAQAAGGEVDDSEAIWNDFDSQDDAAKADADAHQANPDSDSDPDAPSPDNDADSSDDAPPEADKADADPEPVSIEALQEQTKRLAEQVESEKGRARGQQKRADRLQRQLEELTKSQAAQPASDEEAKQSKELLQRVADEYGDVAGPMVKEIERLNSKVGDLSRAEQRHLEMLQGEMDDLVAEETAKLETEHPDGIDVLRRHPDVFRQWIDDQPKAVRAAFEENSKHFVNGTSAAWVVGLFKEHLAGQQTGPASQQASRTQPETSNRRARQMAGAQTVRSKPRRAASLSEPPPDADPEEIWQHYDEMDRRKGGGR